MTTEVDNILDLEITLPEIPAPSEFDALAVGQQLADNTVVLELHIRAPGFRKKIRADSFVRNESKIGRAHV